MTDPFGGLNHAKQLLNFGSPNGSPNASALLVSTAHFMLPWGWSQKLGKSLVPQRNFSDVFKLLSGTGLNFNEHRRWFTFLPFAMLCFCWNQSCWSNSGDFDPHSIIVSHSTVRKMHCITIVCFTRALTFFTSALHVLYIGKTACLGVSLQAPAQSSALRLPSGRCLWPNNRAWGGGVTAFSSSDFNPNRWFRTSFFNEEGG